MTEHVVGVVAVDGEKFQGAGRAGGKCVIYSVVCRQTLVTSNATQLLALLT